LFGNFGVFLYEIDIGVFDRCK